MRLSDLTGNEGRWVRWTDPDTGGSLELKIRRKSGGLEKRIANATVSTKVGRKGKMEMENNHRLALKMLIEGCLLDWRGLRDGDQEYPFSPENALNLLWNGPAELLAFFEEQCERVTQESDEGNAPASDN